MLFNLFAGMYGTLCAPAQRRNRDDARQLRAMSDLELRDLGMGRSEIPAMCGEERKCLDEAGWGNRLL
ncbi:DUF1127 domain-containing protein [Undibacterium sp. TJN25]|uniref:DUF1127 domain-containing protein n=1 Tax=Undibacterium sp. TJN25 TaxID=3413056 RepID=UPI003BF327D4